MSHSSGHSPFKLDILQGQVRFNSFYTSTLHSASAD